jgi:phosphopantetheinyl transferase (holo-ACP synthase)
MQEIKDYINLEENNFLSLFVEPKINIKSTYLTDKEELYLKKITNENRKQEFLQIRALRNKTIGEIEIDYTESGKPFLVNSKEYISISHSQNFIGILKAPFDVGLDIEEINERIIKIKNRFLNEKELKIFDSSIENLTIAWTLKEALFKLNTRNGIDFRKELLIEGKTDDGYNCKMFDLDGWRIVKLKTLQKENLIISYNFEPSILP